MKSDKLSNISGIISVLLTGVGLLLTIALVPLVKSLPEATGLPIFVVVLPTMLAFTFIGVVLGGWGLLSFHNKMHLWGLLNGGFTFLIVVLVFAFM